LACAHNSGETPAGSACHGAPTDCVCTIVLQNYCVHNIAEDIVVFGQRPAVTLPCDRWLLRLLRWKPIGQRRVGRQRQQWDDIERSAGINFWGNGSWPPEMVAIGRH